MINVIFQPYLDENKLLFYVIVMIMLIVMVFSALYKTNTRSLVKSIIVTPSLSTYFRKAVCYIL